MEHHDYDFLEANPFADAVSSTSSTTRHPAPQAPHGENEEREEEEERKTPTPPPAVDTTHLNDSMRDLDLDPALQQSPSPIDNTMSTTDNTLHTSQPIPGHPEEEPDLEPAAEPETEEHTSQVRNASL